MEMNTSESHTSHSNDLSEPSDQSNQNDKNKEEKDEEDDPELVRYDSYLETYVMIWLTQPFLLWLILLLRGPRVN